MRQIALAAAVFTCGLSISSCTNQETALQGKTQESEPQTVPAVRVVRGNVASKNVLTAEFQPFQEVDVMAKVAGYVKSIKVDLGDHVREGQLLAELEVPEMTDDVTKAAAMIEQLQSEIAAAKDDLQRAESAHQIAHLSYTRLQEVSKREPGLIPQQEVDEVRSRDAVAEAQVSASKSRQSVAEHKIQVAKAEETRLKTMRNYITITAPFSGIVTKRYANNGAMIQAGTASQSQAMPLVRLSQISTLRLSLPVPESFVSGVKIGQPVAVRVTSLDKTIGGRVSRFANRVDPATRTMTTEVDVPNGGGGLMPGMYAEVSLQLKEHNDVLTLPVDAVERSGSTARAYTVDGGGTIRVVPVQLGVEDAKQVEIVSGLKESDVVITGRRTGLNAGDKVRVKVNEQ